MKTLTRLILALLFFFLIISETAYSNTDNINKNHFYIGAQGNVFHEYFPYFQQLGFNTYVDWGLTYDFQKYYSWQNGYDRIYGGFYDTLVGPAPPYNPYPQNEQLPDGYRTGEQYFLTQWHNIMNPGDAGSVFMGSARVHRSCMGQSSTYQAEQYDENGAEWTAKYPGYGYSTRQVGEPYNETWLGEQVRGQVCFVNAHANDYNPNNAYIVRSLFENGEQADVISRSEAAFMYSDQKRIGDNFHWFVKPRMRVDAAFANNPGNWSKKVVRVEVYNYAGSMIDSLTLFVRNFLDNNNNYNGNYIEDFRNVQNGQHLLEILSDSLVAGADSSRYYSDPNLSQIDYRIYWYGEADVWLDHVKLDDEWAHFLFTDPWGSLPFIVNPYQFARRMHDEVASINNTGGFALFYMDEFYWNHIPCMHKTDSFIRAWAPNSGIVVMTSYSPGLKHRPTTQQLYDRLKAEGLYDNFVVIDKYPVFYNTPMPPNLHVQDSIRQNYPAITYPGAYQNASNSAQYNQHLNEIIYEQGWYRDDYQKAADVIKTSATNTAFISTIQAHSWEYNFLRINCGQSIEGWEFRREPTNEEISLQAYFSMCYGAKHIHYFMQWSGMGTRECDNARYTSNGLTSWWNVPGSNELPPRYINYYGEHKWDFIASLNSNLMKIGRYMYDQNNLKYDAAISVHKDGFAGGYITNLKSYYRSPIAPYDFNLIDQNSDAAKYWEIGYFTDNNNPNNKYFMLLNMRCVPETPGLGDGDLRTVKIYLNTAVLQGYNSWRLKNPVTNEEITFNKNNISNGISVPGIFNPAEGKLFKLEPVN